MTTHHKFADIEGQTVFYREAGPADAPTLVLLHGFPTSSHMFRELIPALADRYHVIAPDHIGFGRSSPPPPTRSTTPSTTSPPSPSHCSTSSGVQNFALYVQDYGAPIGLRSPGRTPTG